MVHNILNWIKRFFGYEDVTLEALYTGKWQTTRKNHLLKQPCCQICKSIKNLNVHHIVPMSVDPSKEDDPENLVTLCKTCHYVFAHLMSWRSLNTNLKEDIIIWSKKIEERP